MARFISKSINSSETEVLKRPSGYFNIIYTNNEKWAIEFWGDPL